MKKRSDLAGADPYIGEMPETKDRLRRDYSEKVQTPHIGPEEHYRWVTDGKHILVGTKAEKSHDMWRRMTGLDDFQGPHANGALTIEYGWNAEWSVFRSTMSLHILMPIVKKYTKTMGWKFRALLDNSGMPYENFKLGLALDPPEGYEDYYRRIPQHEQPQRYYHVAPRAAREDALVNGLSAKGRTHNTGFSDMENWNPDTGAYYKEDDKGDLVGHEWRPEAIYMWDNPEDAVYYRSASDDDIWEIDPSKVSGVIADPSSAMNWGEGENTYAVEYVPAEALRLRDDLAWRTSKTASIIEKAGPDDDILDSLGNTITLEAAQMMEPTVRAVNAWDGPSLVGTLQYREPHADYLWVDNVYTDPKAGRGPILSLLNWLRTEFPGVRIESYFMNPQLEALATRYNDSIGQTSTARDLPEWQQMDQMVKANPQVVQMYHDEMQKRGMAERSGDPQLDALIEEFLAIEDLSDRLGDGTYDRASDTWHGYMQHPDPDPTELYRDPEWAAGNCDVLATAFDGFVRQHGIEVEHSRNIPSKPAELGYHDADESLYGYDVHSVSVVHMPSGTYMVDWTAAQYGYSEFPMVQRLDQGEWQRDWTSKKAMAERSGDPQLDALIEQFKQVMTAELANEGIDLTDPEQAAGQCGEMDMWFRDWMYMTHPELVGHFDSSDHGWGRICNMCGNDENKDGFRNSYRPDLGEPYPDYQCLQCGALPEGNTDAGEGNHRMGPLPHAQLGYPVNGPDELGMSDRTIPGFDDHAVTLWYANDESQQAAGDPGAIYSIDWTAAQYGYTEFPMVQRADQGQWQRHWAAYPGIGDINPGTQDWHNDEYADTEQYDQNSQVQFYGEQDPVDDEPAPGPRMCSECGQGFPSYRTWRIHVERAHINPERKPLPGPLPVIDMDQAMPAGFNTNMMDKTVQRQSAQTQIAIQGPVPFIFDIEKDRIFVGHPGERHSDIHGRFTPGGIVEGIYKPDGNIEIRTDTDMPYSVSHMLQLWSYMHPELPPKSLYLVVGEKQYRLASANIGHKLRNVAFTEQAVRDLYDALLPYANLYVVGGAVRDTVMGKLPKDIDILVDGVDQDGLNQLASYLPGELQHDGTTFRYKAQDGTTVELQATDDLEADIQGRDFTANAMAVNLATGELYDPFQGVQDVREQKLRATSDDIFQKSPSRLLRALSMISRHGLEPDHETYEIMKRDAHHVRELKGDAPSKELDKLFRGDDPARGIEAALKTGILHHLMPEVASTEGFDQRNKHHRHNLDKHLLDVLHRVAELTPDPDVRMAALLHDIGKPASQWIDKDGHAHYYYDEDTGQGANHADVGAAMAHDRLTTLGYPNERVHRVQHLVQHHMFPVFPGPNGAKKFLKNVGSEHAFDLLHIREGDQEGKGTDAYENQVPVELQRQLVENVLHHKEPFSRKDLAINGHDLMGVLGMPEGPSVGAVLDQLAELVLESPSLNERGTLLDLAKQYITYQNPQPTHFPQTLDKDGLPLVEPEQPNQREANAQPGDHCPMCGTALQTFEDGYGECEQCGWSTENTEGGVSQRQVHPDLPWQVPPSWGREANILDPIHESLDPDVWDNPTAALPKLKPKMLRWIKEHIYRVIRENGWPDPSGWLSLYLSGSLTTYQWAHHSDCDIGLYVDAHSFPDWVRADLIEIMVENLDGTVIPGTTHPIQCYVAPHGQKAEMVYKRGLRSAYAIDKDRWLIAPEHERTIDVNKEFPAIIRYCQMVQDKMTLLLRFSPHGAKIYWDRIHHARSRDMAAGKGDYAESNIIYKWLFNAGLWPELAKVTGERMASLEEEEYEHRL